MPHQNNVKWSLPYQCLGQSERKYANKKIQLIKSHVIVSLLESYILPTPIVVEYNNWSSIYIIMHMIYGESGTETLEQQSQEFNLKTTIRSFDLKTTIRSFDQLCKEEVQLPRVMSSYLLLVTRWPPLSISWGHGHQPIAAARKSPPSTILVKNRKEFSNSFFNNRHYLEQSDLLTGSFNICIS